MTEQMLVDATVGLGFERYVQRVAVGVGAGIEQWCCRREHPLEAYIALDRTVPRFPGREVALLWEETCGWALAVETRSGRTSSFSDIWANTQCRPRTPSPILPRHWARAAHTGS